MEGPRPSAPQASKPGRNKSDASQNATDPDASKPYYMVDEGHYRNTTAATSESSGMKTRHLRMNDGKPLWRKDIQHDFLQLVLRNKERAFTSHSDGSKGHAFSDIYIDAVAKSSRCSGILRDQLLKERPVAINMAMICLLVNVGRMNTTISCKEIKLKNCTSLTLSKFSQKCEPSCEPITRFLLSKSTKVYMLAIYCKIR